MVKDQNTKGILYIMTGMAFFFHSRFFNKIYI